MSQLLKPGRTLKGESSGAHYVIEQFLGGGGQGEVYRAKHDGSPVALKWYFQPNATPAQRSALGVLVKRGSPSPKFLWPLELVSSPGLQSFGYMMRLREAHFRSIVDLVKRRTEPTFFALATAGYHLANSYLQLHAQGLCYRDISFGNVFFKPTDGDILICDNDNVGVNGQQVSGVLGTQRFMAPEVVTGRAVPSTQTDLFSLSVLLFYMLMVGHPLEGKNEASIKCMDAPAMNRLYGEAPLFIFHPTDDSNRPVPGYQDNPVEYWRIYPAFIKTLFTRAFVDGVASPEHGRVREAEWRDAMIRLRDCIVPCGRCQAENFRDTDGTPTAAPACWSCRKNVQLPMQIKIGVGGRVSTVVMLNGNARLFPHHVGRSYEFDAPIAAVVQNPASPNIWGLKNLSPDKWTSTGSDGAIKEVAPGRSITLSIGAKIQFGTVEGTIEA